MKKMSYFIASLVILFTIVFLYLENNMISVSYINLKYENLPDEFAGMKILHLSDLHSKSFGKNQEKLLRIIDESKPDLIAITGDIVDSYRYNEEPVMNLLKASVKIAPVYYVTGNHEWRSGSFNTLEKKIAEKNVSILRNQIVELKGQKDRLLIIGIDDPASGNTVSNELLNLQANIDKNAFKILLAHRPEYFDLYQSFDYDLILSGHAHGGQVRLPFIGGVIAPGQGLLPEYTSGTYTIENSTMVVNRGLGNSIIPQRLFNRPEVILITLTN